MRAFRAAAADGAGVTRDTPRAAALAFFEVYPNRRKCSVIEGESNGYFFVVRISLCATGVKPGRWKDVTKKTALALPG